MVEDQSEESIDSAMRWLEVSGQDKIRNFCDAAVALWRGTCTWRSLWRGCVRCRWIQSCAIAIALPGAMTQQIIQLQGPFPGLQDPTGGRQWPVYGAVGAPIAAVGEKKVRRLEYQHRTIHPCYCNILLFSCTSPLLPPQGIAAGILYRNMKVR